MNNKDLNRLKEGDILRCVKSIGTNGKNSINVGDLVSVEINNIGTLVVKNKNGYCWIIALLCNRFDICSINEEIFQIW